MNKNMADSICNDLFIFFVTEHTCVFMYTIVFVNCFVLVLFFLLKTVYTGIDHHWKEAVFATCGHQVDIWDEQRTSPMCSLTWGFDSISSVKFNPIEVMFLL